MNVVAPLSGVLAAGLPALFGVALGERPSATATLGLVLALPAVWLTARGEGGVRRRERRARAACWTGCCAGLGLRGAVHRSAARGGAGIGLWPAASSQVVSLLPMVWLYVRTAKDQARQPAGAVDAVRSGADGCSRRAGGDLSTSWRHSAGC